MLRPYVTLAEDPLQRLVKEVYIFNSVKKKQKEMHSVYGERNSSYMRLLNRYSLSLFRVGYSGMQKENPSNPSNAK